MESTGNYWQTLFMTLQEVGFEVLLVCGNPLSQALKSAANAIGNLKLNSQLRNFFKRMAFKNGRKEAITATAHKLAVIIYHMLTKCQAYQPYSREINTEVEHQRKLKEISRMMQKHSIGVQELILCN